MDWSYIAGFLDGEGCFKAYGAPRLTVAQKDPEVLYRMMDFMNIHQKLTYSRGCYYLQVCRKELVKRIIDGIYPYVVVKKPDIDDLLERFWPATMRGV